MSVVLNLGDVQPKGDTESRSREKEKTRLCEHRLSALVNINENNVEDTHKNSRRR